MPLLLRLLLVPLLILAVTVAVAAAAPTPTAETATIANNHTHPPTKGAVDLDFPRGGSRDGENGKALGAMLVESNSAVSPPSSSSMPACDVVCATGRSCLYEPTCLEKCEETCGFKKKKFPRGRKLMFHLSA